MHRRSSLALGLGVPFVGIVVALPFVSDTEVTVAGIPLLFLWMFAWFPLTSGCLWLCWHLWDRHDYPESDEEPDA
jgi:hypothetical protein